MNTDFWSQYIAAKKAAAVQGIGESKTIDEIAFDTEVSHGKNAAHAAAAVPSLERLVYSALPGLKKLSKGKYSSYHADSKGAVVDYILEEELELAKKTSMHTEVSDTIHLPKVFAIKAEITQASFTSAPITPMLSSLPNSIRPAAGTSSSFLSPKPSKCP